jgi:hypothetical protein
MFHSPDSRWLLPTLLLLLIGCGARQQAESLVDVSGQVVSDGTPFKVKPEERLSVTFCMVDAQDKPTEKSYLAEVDQKGHFTASLVPGKYRIVLRLKHGSRDNFHSAYGPTNSPFVRDIHEGDSITIDLKEAKKSKT